ncbi:MAG: peptide chain release factor N(5)-glutamine methyltransferase [Proteobacteria bacterium]|nr:peptide chain release factor N(5)-glutamine methyltransferase [Pseudomonadota bacterium]MDA1285091.1 peptide chain release factor N(5)-glutamine methyltransferase [Pseudomonadota bacterium]
MSGTISDALYAATQELAQAGIDNAAVDARHLVAFAMQVPTDRLNLVLNDTVTRAGLDALDKAIAARLERRPVSHIIGHRQFWGRSFKVTPDVLDPRPETETLIEAALKGTYSKVLDLGTGSGCILLTLLAERANSTGMGVDVSPEAMEVALANRKALGLDRPAIFALSDWFNKVIGSFDLIVSNPPYIALPEMAGLAPEVLRWEPMSALTPGLTGLEAYQMIAAGIQQFLAPAGRVLLEVGPSQSAAVAQMFQAKGLDFVGMHKDFDGRERVVELCKPA